MTDSSAPQARQAERRQSPRRGNDVLRTEAAERALMLAQSLIGTNYQNRSERDGIRNFIACMQLALQEPMAIVLLRRHPQSEDYLVLYHTLLDPLGKDHFESYLHTAFTSKVVDDNLLLPAAELGNRVFNIHANYYLMLFRLINYENDINKPPQYHCVNSDSGDIQIEEYLRYFSSNSHILPQFVSDAMTRAFDRRALSPNWRKGKIWRQEQSVKLDYDFFSTSETEFDLDPFFQSHFRKISKIFDESYESIRDSPLLKINQFQPPNIMFSVRMFDRTTARMSKLCKGEAGAYNYGVRGLVPKAQKRDIRAALETLRRIQKDPRFEAYRCDRVEQRFYFPKPALNHLSYEQLTEGDFPLGGNANFGGDSEFFWRLIESDEGFERLCRELESPYGDDARALSDSVFTSGFISVATDPFVKSRAMRLSHKKWIAGDRDLDYRRLVYYHYLLSMAAAGAGSMSALVLPGRVGGSVWFTLGYFFTDQEPYHRRWQNCYHFYHNVATYFIRSIRGSGKRLYLKEMRRLFKRLIGEAIPAFYDGLRVEQYGTLINAYFTLMCRVYPFAKVQVQQLGGAVNHDAEHVLTCEILRRRYQFAVYLSDNPYFESTTGASYLSLAEVMAALR